MNNEAILKTADVLDELPEGYDVFNMGTYMHSCGTPACIAGYAVAVNDEEAYERCRNGVSDVHQTAKRIFGLDIQTSGALFVPGGLKPYGATAKEAAKVLRNFVATGVVS